MVSWYRHIVVMLLFGMPLYVQAQKTWATVQTNKKSVYPGEPVRMSVIVYTSTWFTTSPKFQNLSVPNAFVISFKRTISGMRKVGGQQYASLEYTYQIFPFASGELEIPSFKIDIESPPEGDYIGKASTLETKKASITVNDIPKGWPKEYEWFTAQNVFLSDQWNTKTDTIKVGELLTRKITLNAKGTMPNFIPPVVFTSSQGYRVYQQKVKQLDTRTNQQANGKRIEEWLYLFEQPGEYELPAFQVHWFSPAQQKILSKSSDPHQIVVIPNEELNILQTRIDSLSTIQQVNGGENVDKEILWITYLKWFIATLITYVVVRVIITLVKRLTIRIQRIYHSPENQKKRAKRKLIHSNSHGFEFLHELLAYCVEFERMSADDLEKLISNRTEKSIRTGWDKLQQNKLLTKSDRRELVLYIDSSRHYLKPKSLAIN